MIGQLATILLSKALKYEDEGRVISLFLRVSGAKRVFVIYGGQSAKKRGASLITEKNLYVIGQEEKRQGYNAGIDK